MFVGSIIIGAVAAAALLAPALAFEDHRSQIVLSPGNHTVAHANISARAINATRALNATRAINATRALLNQTIADSEAAVIGEWDDDMDAARKRRILRAPKCSWSRNPHSEGEITYFFQLFTNARPRKGCDDRPFHDTLIEWCDIDADRWECKPNPRDRSSSLVVIAMNMLACRKGTVEEALRRSNIPSKKGVPQYVIDSCERVENAGADWERAVRGGK